jgi:hypothetical protein
MGALAVVVGEAVLCLDGCGAGGRHAGR